MDLRVNIKEQKGETVILDIVGSMDIATSSNLKIAIIELLEKGNKKFLISMKRLDYIDSTALGVIVACFKRVKEKGGIFALFSLTDQAKKLVEITDLSAMIPVYENESEARKGINTE
jgi:anti-sigma B factor antagonist